MTTNYLKQIILLNFISAPVLILFLAITTLSSPEKLMLFIALPGFFVSLFIFKESSLVRYIGLIFLNSLFFGFLFALVFVFYVSVTDGQSEINLIGFLVFFLIFTIPNFLSGLIGVVPKGLIERLKVTKR